LFCHSFSISLTYILNNVGDKQHPCLRPFIGLLPFGLYSIIFLENLFVFICFIWLNSTFAFLCSFSLTVHVKSLFVTVILHFYYTSPSLNFTFLNSRYMSSGKDNASAVCTWIDLTL
jgi:hypothetical protein